MEFLKGEVLCLPVEKKIRGGVSGVTDPRYVEKSGKRLILHKDSNNVYGWAMTQALRYGGYDYIHVSLEKLSATDDDSEIGYLVVVDLEYTVSLKNKERYFPPCPESESSWRVFHCFSGRNNASLKTPVTE